MGKFFLFIIFCIACFNPALASYDVKGREGLNFETLEKMIRTQSLSSVDQVLVAIKKSYPSFFSNYILMYRSRSIQFSSKTHPRVLLVGPEAKFIVAFSGDPNHVSFNVLETMEFVDSSDGFEFREIRMKPQRAPHFSTANPDKCLACHQAPSRPNVDPRPNWEPYSLWPGAFGSGGRFSRDNLQSDDRLRPEDAQFAKDHQEEKSDYRYFERYIKPYNFRYRLLGPFDFNFTVRFTEQLLSLNYRRVVRLAKKTPFYQAYKYAFVSAAKCRYIPWPPAFEKWHTENNPKPESIRFDVPAPVYGHPPELDQFYPSADSEKFQATPPPEPKYISRRLSQSLSAIFEPMGISTQDWSTDFRTEGGRFAFRERFGIPSNPHSKMLQAMKILEPELTRMGCVELEKKSWKALNQFAEEQSGFLHLQSSLDQSLKKRNVPAIQSCTKCHSDPEDFSIPEIPFEDPKALLKVIREGFYDRGTFIDEVIFRTGAHANADEQMPPNEMLTGSQRQQLIQYIEDVAGEKLAGDATKDNPPAPSPPRRRVSRPD